MDLVTALFVSMAMLVMGCVGLAALVLYIRNRYEGKDEAGSKQTVIQICRDYRCRERTL